MASGGYEGGFTRAREVHSWWGPHSRRFASPRYTVCVLADFLLIISVHRSALTGTDRTRTLLGVL